MKNKYLIVLLILTILILVGICGYVIYKTYYKPNNNVTINNTDNDKKSDDIIYSDGIEVLPTMLDKINSDSAYCPTFELVWTDMKNELTTDGVIFNPQLEVADHLNKTNFKEDNISENYYYKKYGLKTLELKSEIEKGIKDKFNQESDILDKFDWSKESLNDPTDPNSRRYFFYTMLYRKFDFLYKFDTLEDDTFKDTKNVKYFGFINGDDKVKNQVTVMYYENDDDFAIKINTKDNDEVILIKKPNGNTFGYIWNNYLNNSSSFIGNKYTYDDELKIPKLEFNVVKDYKMFEGRTFPTNDPNYPVATIAKALQSIKFKLDETGGEVKSEAGLDVVEATSAAPVEKQIRKLYLNDTFALFLKEQDKELPYLALRVEDITKYQ